MIGAALSVAVGHGHGVLCLTFDDSRFSEWEAALPIFERHGAHATFFAYYKIDEKAVASMRRLSEVGHSIGLHGFRHQLAPDAVAKLGEDGYIADEIEPQLSVCRAAGLPVRSFAYPCSRHTPQTDALLLRHFSRLRGGGDFKGAFPASEAASRRYLPGLGIGPNYKRGGAEVAAMLPAVAESNLVLVVYSHGIGKTAVGINMSQGDLETILSAAESLGVAVVGFDELDGIPLSQKCACSADVRKAPHCCEVRRVLEPLKPGEIVARGWLRNQLELSLFGMGGHLDEIEPDQMDKPYITRDFNPANGARGLVGWCAEMGGEYALGAALLAYTLGDDALVAKAAARVQAAMVLQERDGYLGAYRPGDNRQEDYNAWGCHFFYNAMLLEYSRTGDKAILDAVHRGLLWFVRNWSGDRKTDYAGPTIIEPASVVYRLTGDNRLLDFCAEYAAWLDKPGRKNGATFTAFPLTNHAYHVAAIAARSKLPAALAFASGKRDYLDAAIKSYRDFHDGVGWQATYAPCADGEWTAAPSCVGETEYCDFIFYLDLFQWFATLTGETGYADAAERIVFNAAQGARAKDERTIGYMSSPNQWYASLTSSRWGPEPFYHAYAPNMNAACCPANSIRLYPLYVQNAVFREGLDLRVMNYGPYDVRTKINGRDVRVTSETDYPFGKRVTLRVLTDGWDGALRLRRPAWAEGLRLMRGGKPCQIADTGGVVTVAGPWKGCETVVVDFDWRPVVRTVHDRDFANAPLKTVEWGALVFAQPVAEKWERVQRPKPSWGEDNALPQPESWPWLIAECEREPVAYALPQDLKPSDIRVSRTKEMPAHPWQNPPVRLSVPMVRASVAYPPESRDGIHTPIPSAGSVAPDSGAELEVVEFVPFGATCLRTTCFPTAETNLCRYAGPMRNLP